MTTKDRNPFLDADMLATTRWLRFDCSYALITASTVGRLLWLSHAALVDGLGG